MGSFLSWTGTGAHPRWGLSPLNRVPQGLAILGPALQEALGCGTAGRPPSGGPPASTGGRACGSPRSPPCWRPSRTWAPSQPAEPGQPPHSPGSKRPSAGRSWSKGGATRLRAPGAIGWVSPTTAASSASCGASGPSPRPRTRARRRPRCWPPPHGCMPCGTRCCQPREHRSSPHSTPAQRATPTLGRGSRSASSWRRGGGAAGCRSCSKRPNTGVQPLGRPAGEAAEAPPPPSYLSAPAPPRPRPPPRPGKRGNEAGGDTDPPPRRRVSAPPLRPNGDGARRTSPPSLPPPRTLPPGPLPAQPAAQRRARPPTQPAAAGGGAQHAWSADMHSRRDSHRAPPGRPVSLKIGLQIKSNQIPPPSPPLALALTLG